VPAILTFLVVQEMLYISVQDLFFNSNLLFFFRFFRYAQLETPWIQNFWSYYNWIDTGELKKNLYHDHILYQLEYKYNSFLINNFTKIFAWFIFFCLLLLIVTLDFVVSQCTKCRFKTLSLTRQKFFFSGTILFFFACTYPFGYSASIEILEMDFDTELSTFSFAISAFIFAFCLFFWVMMIGLYALHHTHPMAH